MRTADLIVIGAGVFGTFHAYFAALKGYRTLLIERNAWPNDASVRNFGMIVQTIADPASRSADYATGQVLARAAREHGADALLLPSATRIGENDARVLIVFPN